MQDHTATLLFVQLDDFARAAKAGSAGLSVAGSENEKMLFRLKSRDADRKLTLPEAACLLLLFQLSSCRSLKAFLLFNSCWLRPLFPGLPSYSSCVSWLARTEAFLVDFLQTRLAAPGGRESVYAIDSTKETSGSPPASFGPQSNRSPQAQKQPQMPARAGTRGP